MMGYWGYGYGPSSYGLFGSLMMIIFWIIVIFLIVMLVRKSRMHGHSMWKDKTALDILKERYVKGEIDKREFEEKKKDLLE